MGVGVADVLPMGVGFVTLTDEVGLEFLKLDATLLRRCNAAMASPSTGKGSAAGAAADSDGDPHNGGCHSPQRPQHPLELLVQVFW